MQSSLAGMTDYSDQSLSDIIADIGNWIAYGKKIKNYYQNTIDELKECNYWDTKVPFGFKTFCLNMITRCDTICADCQLVISAAEKDRVTKREVKLLRSIYRIAYESEKDLIDAYKNYERDGVWHEYGNSSFAKVEKLYELGRNYFATLFDVSNVAKRMEDYMKEETANVYHTDNSINIGDNNKIEKSTLSTGQTQERESRIKKWWWLFFAPIIAGVIVGIILYLLKMN